MRASTHGLVINISHSLCTCGKPVLSGKITFFNWVWNIVETFEIRENLRKLTNFVLVTFFSDECKRLLRLSLDEFSLPKFYQLFGISKVQSAATTAFRSASRTQSERFGGADRGYSMSPPDRERLSLNSLADITEALLEIMEICAPSIPNCTWLQQWTALAKSFAFR